MGFEVLLHSLELMVVDDSAPGGNRGPSQVALVQACSRVEEEDAGCSGLWTVPSKKKTKVRASVVAYMGCSSVLSCGATGMPQLCWQPMQV